jgi:hypothetical protein
MFIYYLGAWALAISVAVAAFTLVNIIERGRKR